MESSLEQVRKQFHIVGYCELAASGRSLKVKITDAHDSVFEKEYFINRESVVQVLHGHRKDATVFILEPKE